MTVDVSSNCLLCITHSCHCIYLDLGRFDTKKLLFSLYDLKWMLDTMTDWPADRRP
jgi:hypothetical protein